MTTLINRHSRGVYVISATPFTETGALDLDSTDRMVDGYLAMGVDGMTILGIMGEAPKLTAEESVSFAARVLDRVNGRVPVIVGVSGAGLDMMAALTAAVMDAGAAGVMVAPPRGLSPEDRQRRYYAQVAAALGEGVPICLQDFPQTTSVQFSVETLLAITRDVPQVVMLKHEDYPGLAKLSDVRAGSETGDVPRISILSGNSGLFLPLELGRGADGAMTGFAYPEMMVDVVRAYAEGSPDRADDLFDAYLPLVRYDQQPGIGLAIRKEILRRRGLIASPTVRAPGPKLSSADHEELSRLMARLERRLAELG
ncbi:MAG: dihydrodipicolinate synthase family protein [Pseudomonadota bacterium]